MFELDVQSHDGPRGDVWTTVPQLFTSEADAIAYAERWNITTFDVHQRD